jgi:perosamine synthetase
MAMTSTRDPRGTPEFRIPFSGRGQRYTDDELQVVLATARDAVPMTGGAHRATFEAALAGFLGVDHAFAVATAAGGLDMIAQMLCLDPGDEVIIPSHTYTASAYPFVKHGGRLVWADIDPTTRVVTVETLRARITSRTRAIIVVHLYGYGADMPAIMDLAAEHGIVVIEDAAQAIGVMIEGRRAGSFGDLGVISFHSHKNMSTLGEGGALIVRDPALAAIVPPLRHNGHRPYPEPRSAYWVPAMSDVDLIRIGDRELLPNNYCLAEVQCALGTKLLERVDERNGVKRTRALRVIDALADLPGFEFHREDSSRHNYHLLVAQVPVALRDEVIGRMAFDHGVQCVVQYQPLDRYPLYRKLGFGDADCPNADRLYDGMVSFPFQQWLTDDEIDRIVDAARVVGAAVGLDAAADG